MQCPTTNPLHFGGGGGVKFTILVQGFMVLLNIQSVSVQYYQMSNRFLYIICMINILSFLPAENSEPLRDMKITNYAQGFLVYTSLHINCLSDTRKYMIREYDFRKMVKLDPAPKVLVGQEAQNLEFILPLIQKTIIQNFKQNWQ